MNTSKLAEAIILQAMDDLFNEQECDGSVEFFTGSGFAECATLACMGYREMRGVLDVVYRIVSGSRPPLAGSGARPRESGASGHGSTQRIH